MSTPSPRTSYVQDLVHYGVDMAAYEAAALKYPYKGIPAGQWTKGLAAYDRAEMAERPPRMPSDGPWAREITFQRHMIGEYKNALSKGETPQTVIAHCPHTGKPLTRRDVMAQYACLLAVCTEKLGNNDSP